FTDTTTTRTYPLSLHDALPICPDDRSEIVDRQLRQGHVMAWRKADNPTGTGHGQRTVKQINVRLTGKEIWHERRKVIREHVSSRSEEHTSELQSRFDLVCRLLL